MSDRAFDWLRIVLLALAVAGLLLSGQLVRMHAGEKVADSLDWACGGLKHTCETVLQSGFARLMIFPPRPVPVAAVGMGYFTFLGLWLLMTGRLPGRLHHAWVVPSVVGLFGLAASGFMIYLMGAVLKTWCGFCLATHIVNLPLVLGIWILWTKGAVGPAAEAAVELPAAPEGERLPTGQPAPSMAAAQLWKIPVLVVIAGVAIAIAQVRQTQTTDAVKSLEAESAALDRLAFNDAKKVDIPVGPEDPVLGPEGARHTVVIYSDFQCPYCGSFAPMFEEVQKALSMNRDISKAPFRIVFKHYPLNPDCNAGRRALLAGNTKNEHPHACEAAAAAEAARRLGGNEAFWKMHDALYKNQARLGQVPYRQLGCPDRPGSRGVRETSPRPADPPADQRRRRRGPSPRRANDPDRVPGRQAHRAARQERRSPADPGQDRRALEISAAMGEPARYRDGGCRRLRSGSPPAPAGVAGCRFDRTAADRYHGHPACRQSDLQQWPCAATDPGRSRGPGRP